MYGDYYQYPYHGVDEASKRRIWEKARPIRNHDPDEWRKDICGAKIRYSDHGMEGEFGWEIDHIFPSSKGGKDDLTNLQPLYWKNNRVKSDTYPWNCEGGYCAI